MSSTYEKNRSRFGHHPCEFQLYLKLKFLHKHYWIAVRQFHTWHRWHRKEPQNRTGTEPKYCPVFVENRPWAKTVKRGFKLYSRTLLDHGLLELFAAAKTPLSEPVEPFDDATLIRIDSLDREVKEYLSERELGSRTR